jgi:uncharacterized protein YkuJ
MKKIFIYLLVILAVGYTGYAENVLKTKGNPVADILSKNHPGGYAENDPIYSILSPDFYWGETKDSIQEKMPYAMTFIGDNGKIYQYRTSTGLREGTKTITISVDHVFDLHKRLSAVLYGIIIHNTIEKDLLAESISGTFLKILKDAYGNNPRTESAEREGRTITEFTWGNQDNPSALLYTEYREQLKGHSIEVYILDPTFIAE